MTTHMYDYIDFLHQLGIELAGEAQERGAQLGAVHRDLIIMELDAPWAQDFLHSKSSLAIVVRPHEANNPLHHI
jgi:hypothetical protein